MTGSSTRFIRASRAPSRSFSSSGVTRPLWLHVAAISLPRSTESRALPLLQLPPLQATPLQARASRTFSPPRIIVRQRLKGWLEEGL